jgi:hypothetical protein
MKKLDNIAGELYLELLVATDYPEHEPEYLNAKWYDLLWFIVPICGFLIFVEQVRSRKS